MAHPKHEEWMKYLYGELAPPKQQTLADHLQDCGECREQVGAWQTAIKVLDRGKQVDGGRSSSVRYFLRGAARWAAVVFLILGLGFVMGRFTAAAPDMSPYYERLEALLASSVEPTLQQTVSEQLNAVWVNLMDDKLAQHREAIYQDLDEIAASYSTMNQVLTDLILDRDQAGMQERYMIMEALEQMEQQQAADHEELINAVENLITNMKELGLRR